MLSVCRHPPAVALPFLFPRSIYARNYTQQHVARTPRSTPQQSTTNPSPTSQVKNRSLPSATSSGSNVQRISTNVVGVGEKNSFLKVRQEEKMREMEETGDQLEMLRIAYSHGIDPFASKAALMDLRIPSKINSFSALKDNVKNDIQNLFSMFRLASDYAFPGIIPKFRLSPQLFKTKSTSEKAWVAPFRHDLLDVYKRLNHAIAFGDKKTLKELTAYEYQQYAHQLLQRNLHRSRQTGLTYHWSIHSLVSPAQILSLRAYPMYTAPEEPKYGNRNIVQALVRFETMQSLTLRDAKGRIVKPDGTVVAKAEEAKGAYTPEPKRVLEYLICENKMFYKDGWYVRDQIFEGVKPKFAMVGTGV